jgi:hypothetical protein
LALVAEAAQDEIRVHPALDELDGNALLKSIVGTLGQVNGPHPAPPYFFDNLVCAYPFTDYWVIIYERC